MADTAKFTPGPWKAVKAAHGPIDIIDPRGRDVVTVYGGGVETESQSANARLIAAAPDLLEEVVTNRNAFAEFAEFILNRPDKSAGITRDECAAMFADMQRLRLACDAVIAKATGGR